MISPQYGRSLVLVVIAGSISGCGGGVATPTQEPSFQSDVSAFDTSFTEARSMPFSNGGSVASADGTYEGESLVRVIDGGDTTTFLGNASLTVDIARGRVSGTLSGFARDTDDVEPEGLSGRLTVTGQSIGAAQQSEFVSTVTGTLTGSSTDFRIGDGTVFGDLLENPTSSLIAQGTSTNSRLDGTSGLTSTINILADKN